MNLFVQVHLQTSHLSKQTMASLSLNISNNTMGSISAEQYRRQGHIHCSVRSIMVLGATACEYNFSVL